MEETAARGGKFVGEKGFGGLISDGVEDEIAKSDVVVLDECGRHDVDGRVDRICGVGRKSGWCGVDAWVSHVCALMNAVVRALDGVYVDGVLQRIFGSRVMPVVGWSRHVSCELSGLAFTEEDGLAVVMDDGIRDESVERRCRRRDGRLHLSDPAEDGLVGTVPERVGLSVLCERLVRLVVLRGGVVDWRESSSVLAHCAGCYHIEGR